MKRLDRLGVIASCACFVGAAERAPGADAAVWRPEEWSIRRLLDALDPAVREARAGIVRSALDACPGSAETFVMALLDRSSLGKLQADPLAALGPLDAVAAGECYSNRAWGLALSDEPPGTVEALGMRFQPMYRGYTSPLILDLDGDGLASVDGPGWEPHPGLAIPLDRAVPFDIDGDGFAELTEWVGPKAGILVLPDDPGKIVGSGDTLGWYGPLSGRDLLGTADGFRDGFSELRARRDLDRDGEVDISDGIRILGYLFGGSPGDETLPPPWPEPGTDPTTDDLGCAGS